jgi:hypothetical protein
MAAAGRSAATEPAPAETAAQLRAARFVRVHGIATGEGLAATGQLARALAAAEVPFQASLGRLGDPDPSSPVTDDDHPSPTDDRTGTDGDLTVAVGRPDVAGDLALGGTASRSVAAYDVARELAADDDRGVPPAPTLALAGLVAADADDPERRADLVEAAGVERRPGLGFPVANPADGLAHTTLLHTAVSGDAEAAAKRLGVGADPGVDGVDAEQVDTDDGADDPTATAGIEDEETGSQLASVVALTIAEDGGPPTAAESAEAVLRPRVGGPFETVPGYADLLGALAAREPGLGLELAMVDGEVDESGAEKAIETWRAHGDAVHAAVRGADAARHDGLVVVTGAADEPTWAEARLRRDFVSPEPVVVVVGQGVALATTRGDPGSFAAAVEAAGDDVDGTVVTSGSRARAVVDSPTAFADALTEAI